MKKLAFLAIAAIFVTAPAWAAKGRIQSGRDSKSGDIVWQKASKKYKVSYKQGKTMLSAEFALEDVDSIDIEKPAGLDDAIKSKNVAGLKKIVGEYLMLKWDRVAGKALIEALLKQDKGDEAYKIAREIIKDDTKAAYLGEFAPAYWRALLAAGEKNRLENCLRMAATEGDRLSSANALIMRGDMICASAESPDWRKALVDAYLRVALMYQEEECKPARIEAVERAKKCFTELGMPSRVSTVEEAANIR